MLHKYKLFEFTAYEVYDLLHYRDIGKIFQTIEDAERGIKKYNAEIREELRKRKKDISTFVPFKYLIIEMVGTVESELVKNWKEGIIDEFKLKD